MIRRALLALINRLAAIGDAALTAAFPSAPEDLTDLAEAVGVMGPLPCGRWVPPTGC